MHIDCRLWSTWRVARLLAQFLVSKRQGPRIHHYDAEILERISARHEPATGCAWRL